LLTEYVDGWQFYRTPSVSNVLIEKCLVAREAAHMRTLTQRLRDVIKQLRPDILHAHSPVLNAIPALRMRREFGIPLVYEVRALWEDAAVDHGTAREWGVRYRMTRHLETYALKRADAITTICDGLRRDLIGRNIPEDRITVIPNAVDPEQFTANSQTNDEPRKSLGLQGKFVLGFVGSFYHYEGLHLLLLALPRLLQLRPNTAVLLVGGGPQELYLKQLAKTLGVEDKVVFAGRLPQDKVGSLYSLIDVLVYPRLSIRLTELVTPLKPLEAMAQGRLVVASDVGGHKELIQHQRTGLLFEAGSVSSLIHTIVELFRRYERWDVMKEEARRFVQTERTWSRSVTGYCSVYEALARKT